MLLDAERTGLSRDIISLSSDMLGMCGVNSCCIIGVGRLVGVMGRIIGGDIIPVPDNGEVPGNGGCWLFGPGLYIAELPLYTDPGLVMLCGLNGLAPGPSGQNGPGGKPARGLTSPGMFTGGPDAVMHGPIIGCPVADIGSGGGC